VFNTYSQLRDHVRTVAFLHPQRLPNWPDMVRQGRNENVEARLYKSCAESRPCASVAGLMAPFMHWQLNLWRRPARRARVGWHYSPHSHHSQVHR
jgi:hypothetical protein